MHFRPSSSCEKTILTFYSLQKTRKREYQNRIQFSIDFGIDFGWFFHDFSMFFPYFWGIDFHIDFWKDFVWLSGPASVSIPAQNRARRRPGGPGSTEISTKSQIGVSPDPPHASRMLHGGHIRHLVCLLGHPGPPFEIVL